jgi:putative CocE/NonD family hydrolase
MVQWALAGDAGPDLKAIAAQITTSDPGATIYQGGAFALETMLGWTDQVARQERPLAFLRQGRAQRRLAPMLSQLPLGDLDQVATGRRVGYWQDWLEHDQPGDGYWASRSSANGVGAVTAPVSFVGGWQDPFLPGLLADYRALAEAGREPYLLIGPWRHTDQAVIAASMQDTLAWLRAHLLGDRTQLRPAPVRIFIGGAGAWRDLPAWPPPASAGRWHLHPGAELRPEPPGESPPDSYVYDPADPTPSVGGPAGHAGQAQPDNRALESRPDVLTYTSPPLERALEIAGPVTADLFVRSSRDSTDFFARLCDVDGAGKSVNVCDALLRIKPGCPAPGPDGIIRASIGLWPAAHRFRAGHRLRLQVSSGAHPRYARNPGTGEPLAAATTLVSARQQVYHDPAHPSGAVLPVYSSAR